MLKTFFSKKKHNKCTHTLRSKNYKLIIQNDPWRLKRKYEIRILKIKYDTLRFQKDAQRCTLIMNIHHIIFSKFLRSPEATHFIFVIPRYDLVLRYFDLICNNVASLISDVLHHDHSPSSQR